MPRPTPISPAERAEFHRPYLAAIPGTWEALVRSVGQAHSLRLPRGRETVAPRDAGHGRGRGVDGGAGVAILWPMRPPFRSSRPAVAVVCAFGFAGIVVGPAPAAGRAEDPPPAGAAPALAWQGATVIGDLAVSRDGKWLAGRAREGFQLFPVAGGAAVTLDLGKNETGSFRCAFTADSKWLVVPGESAGASVPGVKKDLTQTLIAFPVDTPNRPKRYTVRLEEEDLPKEIRKRMPSGSAMKQVVGAVFDVAPLTGSKVLCERLGADDEIRDVATGATSPTGASLAGPSRCGLSADAAQSVLVGRDALEIRDVQANRVRRAIPVPAPAREFSIRRFPRFTPDGAAVVVAATTTRDGSDEVVIECWSVETAKLLWSAPLGKVRLVEVVACGGGFAVVVADAKLRLLALGDGSEVAVPELRDSVQAAVPTAEGDGLWIAGNRGIRKMPWPAATPR